MYDYKVKIIKVVDGDTVDVDIDLGFNVWLRNERVRIMGIDTPESRTRNPVEKVFGLAAKKRLGQLLGKYSILKTQVDKSGQDMKGKFGRILGDFIVEKLDGEISSIAKILIDEGHAVEYYGQSKDLVQNQHAKNRERLIAERVVILDSEASI